MRLLPLVVLLGAIAPALPASAEDTSGTYIGKDATRAIFLQFVRTSDGRLTGRYEQVVLQTDGKLERFAAAVTGASDMRTVVVTIKSTESPWSITASGTIDGSALHLTGAGSGSRLDFILVKSEEADFQSHVAVLSDRASQIIAARAKQEAAERQAKAEADFHAHIENLIQKMATVSTRVDPELAKFPPIEQRYRAITEAMRAALMGRRDRRFLRD